MLLSDQPKRESISSYKQKVGGYLDFEDFVLFFVGITKSSSLEEASEMTQSLSSESSIVSSLFCFAAGRFTPFCLFPRIELSSDSSSTSCTEPWGIS